MAHIKNNFKIFRIQSQNRESNSISACDFNYKLNIPASESLRVLCARCVVPKSYFNLPNSNTLVLTYLGTDYTITIPIGNYDINDMITAIKTQLELAVALTFTISINLIIGKLSFTATGLCSISNCESNLAKMLGLNLATTYNFPFTSSNICIYNSHDSLTISSTLVSHQESNFMATISAAQSLNFDYITHTSSSWLDSRHITQSRSNIYNFKLMDSNNNTIDLNGLEWSLDLHVFEDLEVVIHNFMNNVNMFISMINSRVEPKKDEKNKNEDELKEK